jgi:hypothetical protein
MKHGRKKNIDKLIVFGNKAGNGYRDPGLDAPKTEEIHAVCVLKRSAVKTKRNGQQNTENRGERL